MKPKILLLSLILLTSCNLKETFKKYDEINNDLKVTFSHNKINLNQHWGSDENDNYILITFYDFNLESKSYKDLEKLSDKVIYRVLAKNTDYKKLDFIEVQFTNQDKSKDLDSYISFKMRHNRLNY